MTLRNITTLSYGQFVRIAGWDPSESVEVFTLRGYCEKNGSNYERALAASKAHGHATAGTISTGATLVGDRALAAKLALEALGRAALAEVIADGQEVEIEGDIFRVRVVPGNAGRHPRNSDPIHFIPVA